MYPISQGVKDWTKYQEWRRQFISKIDDEHVIYWRNLQYLLYPLEAELDENGYLYKDPDSSLWHNPVIQTKLRQSMLEDEYHWLMGIIRTMSETMDNILKILSVHDGMVSKLVLLRLILLFKAQGPR
jgi:hypothetical protein